MSTVVDQALNHKSIRKYKSDPVPEDIFQQILQAGLQSSSSGNMQSWSVIVSSDPKQKERLHKMHLEQQMILDAPLVLTFCADFHRMRRWLKLRDAKDGFDDLSGFLVASFDAVIAAQSIALAAESKGLGICYMGTTLWCANELVKELKLPQGVVPVTSIVMGYPDEEAVTRDRLPLNSIVHQGTYQERTDDEILEIYNDREVKGWKRYQDRAGEEFMNELKEANVTNLAQFYTSDYKYSKEAFAKFARDYLECLKTQDFWNF